MTRSAIAAVLCGLLLAACSKEPEPAPAEVRPPDRAPEPTAAAPDQAHDHAQPAAQAAELPAIPEGAKVHFVEPADGAKLTGPLENGKVSVTVKMGAEKIAIKPAGPVEAGSGHHHVLVDVADGIAEGGVVPKDERHLHFGKGETEANIALAPGEHTLTLQLADGLHRSYGPKLAATIKVEVAAEGSVAAATH